MALSAVLLIGLTASTWTVAHNVYDSASQRARRNNCVGLNVCYLNWCGTNEAACHQNSTCHPVCTCKGGWEGSRCDIRIPEIVIPSSDVGPGCQILPCIGTSCHNGGTCYNDEDRCIAFCDCAITYTGDRCQTLVNSTTHTTNPPIYCGKCIHGECAVNQESGLKDLFTNYICQCHAGWQGPFCDIESMPCPLQCRNEGTCRESNHTNQMTVSTIAAYQSTAMFTCQCAQHYVGQLCEHFCNLTCGEHGHCDVIDGEQHCVCNFSYTGNYCSVYSPPQHIYPQWYWYVVGTVITLAVILLTATVVIPIIMWWKRALIIMKIRHYFRGFEDDDGKEFDAFISYRSTERDQNFVVSKMFYTLEQIMGFKVCVHFKDFKPGTPIADNILWAVQSSRRTILIISPDYIKGEWTRLEYQLAQQEMLRLRQRIIPVILEDIDDVIDEKLDANLKYIINSVTYIKYPLSEEHSPNSKLEQEFWERLRLAMPKKRQLQKEENDLATIVDTSVGFDNPVYNGQSKQNLTPETATSCENHYESIYDTPRNSINKQSMPMQQL